MGDKGGKKDKNKANKQKQEQNQRKKNRRNPSCLPRKLARIFNTLLDTLV